MTRTAGIVLAGGRSSRFGGDKLAATLGESTVLDLALRAVAAVADEVLIAGGAEPEPATSRLANHPAARHVPDVEPFAGPLAALAGALASIDAERVIVVGGDMPGLVPDLLGALVSRLDDPAVDASILGSPPGSGADSKRQVLPLALRVAPARAAAAATLGAGDRSLTRLLDRLRLAELPSVEWLALDPGARTLLDVDTPTDLDRIREIDLRRTPSGGLP